MKALKCITLSTWNPTCVQSFRFELSTVFEVQGLKLNNKKNKQQQKNWENELFVIISLVSGANFTIILDTHVAYSYHSAVTELLKLKV